MSLEIIHPASEALTPFGEVTLAPEALTGRSRSQLAQDMIAQDMMAQHMMAQHMMAQHMAEHLRDAQPASGADALRLLRNAFPHSPLSARVVALAAMMRR